VTIIIEQTSATSALVITGEPYVRDVMRRLGVLGMRDVKTRLWWLPAARVDDVAAMLEQRKHSVETRQTLG
jgi:hypothetical protein